MSMKLLLVEDEPRLAGRISAHLGREGFSVEVTSDGADALARASSLAYDCILLDLGLPGAIDGLEVCRELRRSRVHTSVLIITARDALDSRIEGLDAGVTTISSSRSPSRSWPHASVRSSGARPGLNRRCSKSTTSGSTPLAVSHLAADASSR